MEYITFKLDNHIVEIEKGKQTSGYITIWFNYDNNQYCTQSFYDIDKKKLVYANYLTRRQADILLKKMNKLYKV